MKKSFLILFSIFVFLLFPNNVFALEPSGMRMYYTNDQGQSLNTSTTANQNWSGYNVKYITMGFDGASFSSLPDVMYSFFNGYNCSENCRVTGSFMNYVPFSVTSLNNNVIVQIEANGMYNTCSVSSVTVHATYFEKIDFTCYTDKLTNGFNLVESNFAVYPNKYTYYGIAYDTISIKSDIGTGDIINNNNQNTQNIINNNNQNTQNIINNNNQNTSSIINNMTSQFQNVVSQVQQQIQATNNVDNTMKDDTVDASYQNSTLDNLNNQMASNSVISDLLLLPVRMYQKILDSLGSNSCTTYDLGSLYGTNLQLPCIQVQNYIGSALWTTIDLIFCGMFILVIRKKFVDIFNNMTNLKDGGNDVE